MLENGIFFGQSMSRSFEAINPISSDMHLDSGSSSCVTESTLVTRFRYLFSVKSPAQVAVAFDVILELLDPLNDGEC